MKHPLLSSSVVVMFLISFMLLGLPLNAISNPAFSDSDVIQMGAGTAVAGEILVKFKPNISNAAIQAINRSHRTTIASRSPFAQFLRLRLPPGLSVAQAAAAYGRLKEVEYAEPNYIRTALFRPNDTYYSYQWHLDNASSPNPYGGANGGGINIEPAWDIATGAGVVVAVIDSGVAYENYTEPASGKTYYSAPDLANTSFVSGYDFVQNDTHPNDDNGHGTHVTGTIAQSTNNSIGTAGVAFNASIMPVKVLDAAGSGTDADVADGIWFAADHGADVINMSLGGPQTSTTLQNAVAHAYQVGVTVVCAAGNEGDGANRPSYPAAYDAYCIAVAATRYDEQYASYSNYGSYVDIAAPGGDVTVDQNGDGYGDGVLQNTFNPNTGNTADFGYWFFEGTSMATPHVAGVAALLISRGVTSPNAVRTALQNTAEEKGSAGWDSHYGWGIVDAYAALQYNASAAPKMHISGIGMILKVVKVSTSAQATVTVVDAAGSPVSGATVSSHWSGATSDRDTGITDANGIVRLESNKLKRPRSGTVFTFTVDTITRSGWVYDTSANVRTSNSITVP